jgi:hypothetical protein
MNNFSRRQFFQVAGGALGAIGLNQLTLSHRANIYGRALAQATPRKVALLVGVNDYSRNSLDGAINDVELQKHLLIHRFGFNPADVHTLQNEQASRRDILGAFNEYLYEPASAGDVVVFHFSGHGDRVRESELMREFTNRLERNCIDNNNGDPICLNTVIAPYRHAEEDTDTVQDIMGHTLLLMRAALAKKTDNVTFVLDCCYAGGGKRGNAVMRSLNDPSIAVAPSISDSEWETQQEWLGRLGWSLDNFAEVIASPTGQGYFVGAAKLDQLAADYSFDGFVAGAFTYLLTQHLWQATGSPSLSDTILTVTNSSAYLSQHSQTPDYDPQPSSTRSASEGPIYHVSPVSPPAEAIVLPPAASVSLGKAISESGGMAKGSAIAENRVRLWIGGLDPQRLEAFDQGAVFSVIDRQTGSPLGEIQQVEGTRRELTTEGILISNSRGLSAADLTGQLLQERTRGIPDKVILKIALDNTLTPTEQQFTTGELSRSPSFEISPVTPGRAVHVLLGRYTEAIDQFLTSNQLVSKAQSVGSIGLFSPDQIPILAGSFGPVSESIEAAIARLKPRFVSLHIGRMLALMVNGQASQLNVSVVADHRGSRSGTTTRGGSPEDIIIPKQSEQGIEQVSVGNQISITVKNNESIALHFGLLAIDVTGEVLVLFPPTSDDPNIDLIESKGFKTKNLNAIEPVGIVELLVLASPQSLVGPLETLRDTAALRGAEVSAADVMSDLFGAMGTRRGATGETTDTIEGTRLLDVDDVAVLSLLFEIVSG